MRKYLSVIAITLGAAVHLPVFATKPCLPTPCESKGGTIDVAKCTALSDWVATGTITNVIHHEQGYPLLKDFAEFTFTAQDWEKGAGKAGQEIRFSVGWCENTKPLPADISGTFRFFGLPLSIDPTIPNQYLHFEPVAVRK